LVGVDTCKIAFDKDENGGTLGYEEHT